MTSNPWQKKRRIESEYANNMSKLTDFFFGKAVNELNDLDQIQERLRSASANPVFQEYADATASRMDTGLRTETARNWREAASKGTQGREVNKLLMMELQGVNGARTNGLVRQNADLIRSLPLDVAQKFNAFIQRQQAAGKRFEAMNLKKYVAGLTKTRIALIARTETSKASTALTRSRAEDIGLDWYIWRTSKDGRVRPSHSHMDGVMVNWNDTPSPEALKGIRSRLGSYHAGDSPNCRCYPEPVVSLSSVRWPHKVYHNGSIVMMTRSKFEQIVGQYKVAA